jgi:hypothetical protein
VTDYDSTFELRKQLKSVRAAIARIEEGAQSASIGDMSYTESDISKLYMREKHLLKKLNRKTGNRPTIKQVRLV